MLPFPRIAALCFASPGEPRRALSRAVAATSLLASLLGSPLLAGCAGQNTTPQSPMQYAEDARKAYDKALEAFLDHDWEEARSLMGEVRRKYAYSRYARLAELRLADIDYEQEKFASAITGYRAFVHDHRTDESVPYARFRICKGLYAQISDTVLLPPQEERDQGAASDAYRELNAFLLDHPGTKWQKEAQFMLVMVTGRLVRHELYVARYYLKRDNFEAAASRVRYALRNFDGSGLEPEGMLILAETYMKMKKRDDARQVLEQLLAVYPASPFTVPARRFLADMGVAAPQAPSAPPPTTPLPPEGDPNAKPPPSVLY